MKKTVVLFFLLSIVLTGFSQVKLDYNAKPKSDAKGFSTKGLSASSAHFLYQLRQVEATTDRSLKASLYAQLQKDYNITQGKVSAIIVLAKGQTPQKLAAYDVTVGTVCGEMVTAMIPVARFGNFETISNKCSFSIKSLQNSTISYYSWAPSVGKNR